MLKLGTTVKASGYMVPYSSIKAWRERNPGAESVYPDYGVKGLKRRASSFAGVYVGKRVRKIKYWWVTDRGHPEYERWHSHDTWLTLVLIAYSTRARLRYVLPRDVEVVTC